jgi:DNA mismatch endonuclease, patch repair protein
MNPRLRKDKPLGTPPLPTSEATTKTMKANKGKDTLPEIRFRKALVAAGLSGYRLHRKSVPGRPDISFPGRKVAIFINGCFWHRCPRCRLPLPKAHRDFWRRKFNRNMKRDQEKLTLLGDMDWFVFVFWECEIRKDIDGCVSAVKRHMIQSGKKK